MVSSSTAATCVTLARTTALDWFRSVYDYDQPPANRKIAYKLVLDAGEPVSP